MSKAMQQNKILSPIFPDWCACIFSSSSATEGVSSVLALSSANQSMTRIAFTKLWRRTHVGHQPSIRANQHCHRSSTGSQLGSGKSWKMSKSFTLKPTLGLLKST